jgi:hypothetical protein
VFGKILYKTLGNHKYQDYQRKQFWKGKKHGYSPVNIYHCCTWKSASQWFSHLFSHHRVLEYTGLQPYSIKLWSERLNDQYNCKITRPDQIKELLCNLPSKYAFPKYTAALHMYLSYSAYSSIKKSGPYKTFFVLRDPRDLVVSYYFSMLKTHYEFWWVKEIREKLKTVSLHEGLKLCVQSLHKQGIFDDMVSWVINEESDRNVKVFKFEDLSDSHERFINNLFDFLDIKISNNNLQELYDDLSFSAISKGRKIGSENVNSHYRKGKSGDWRNYFTEEIQCFFDKYAGDKCKQMGYTD